MNIEMIWPEIVSGIIVAACSLVITKVVQRAGAVMEKLATKDFVIGALAAHGTQLKIEIGEMFVRANAQALVNADVEARVRRVENAFGVKLQMLGAEILQENRKKED